VKYVINFGTGAVAIPEKVVEIVGRTGSNDLKVFLLLCAAGGVVDIKKISVAACCSQEDVKESLSFWRGAGIISLADDSGIDEAVIDSDLCSQHTSADDDKNNNVEKPEAKPIKKLRCDGELPHYTSAELADILEEKKETATLIDECQHIMGKVFNVKEINVLMGLLDYLGLDCEYIMILLTYCVSIGKKTLHYAEKTAFSLYDAGITTAAQLECELKRREAASAAEGKIRSLFGVGERAFTTKEKKFISSWINDMDYSMEIIEKAYEITVDATGKGAFAYANSVLERWNSEGLRTIEQIEESYLKDDKDKKPSVGSFDTDSFFEAAVRRSLGE